MQKKIQEILARYLAAPITESRQTATLQELINAGVPDLAQAQKMMDDASANPGLYMGPAGGLPLPSRGEEEVVRDILGGAERGATAAGRGLEILRRQQGMFGRGPFAPFVEQGLGQRFNPTDMNAQFLLDLFGQSQAQTGDKTLGTAPTGTFREFMGGFTGARPDSAVLASRLANILTELEQGESNVTDFTEALQSQFADPRVSFRAALQPALAQISPALRQGFERRATERFLGELAEDPSRFATPVQAFREFAPRSSRYAATP